MNTLVNIARSGFRNVRLCNDCRSEITKDGRCNCPCESPWRSDMPLTVCSDEQGEHPIALGQIGPIGNGAFRLKGSKDWFSIPTGKAVRDESWVRPRREGDEATIGRLEAEKKQKAEKAAEIVRLESTIRGAKHEVHLWRTHIQAANREASHHESRAKSYREQESNIITRVREQEANILRLEATLAALRALSHPCP